MISLTFVTNSNGSHGTVGKTTGFSSGRYGFESQLLPTLYNLTITTENCDTPTITHEKFQYQNSSEARKGSYTKFFWYCEKKINLSVNRDTRPSLIPIFFSGQT